MSVLLVVRIGLLICLFKTTSIKDHIEDFAEKQSNPTVIFSTSETSLCFCLCIKGLVMSVLCCRVRIFSVFGDVGFQDISYG